MRIRLVRAPKGARFSGPTFWATINKEVSVPIVENTPVVIDIAGGTDEDLKTLAKAGFVFEKIETRPRLRPWLVGMDYVE